MKDEGLKIKDLESPPRAKLACKINRQLSMQRKTIVWDVVKEKYEF